MADVTNPAGEVQSNARPYMKFFILYGLLSMGISVMWGAWNNYLPIILQAGNSAFTSTSTVQVSGFGLNAFQTGLLMTIHSVFILFVPIFGAWGDRTTKRRQLGVIMGLITIAAYSCVPLIASTITPADSGNLHKLMPLLIITVILVFIVMISDPIAESFRSSYQYNMVPKHHQGKLSSYGVFLGGTGFLIATFIGTMLYNMNHQYPFYVGAAIELVIVIAFALFSPPETEKDNLLREERASANAQKFNPFKVIAETFRLINRNEKIAIVLIFAIKILVNFGIYGMQTYGSSYLYKNLGIAPNIAMIATLVYFMGYMLMSIPIGVIADKINRSILFAIGSIVMIVGAFGILFMTNSFALICIWVFFIGMASSIMDVLVIPYVMSFAPSTKNVGTLYSTAVMFISVTSLISTPLLGLIITNTGSYSTLFYVMIVCSALSLIPNVFLYRISKLLPNLRKANG